MTRDQQDARWLFTLACVAVVALWLLVLFALWLQLALQHPGPG